MRSSLFLGFALLIQTPLAAQQGATPPVLKPVGNWVLDYGENRCRIVRTFARDEGGETTLLFFEQYDPKTPFIWLVAGEAVPNRSRVSVHFGPVNDEFEVAGRGVKFGDFDNVVRGRSFKDRGDRAAQLAKAIKSREAAPGESLTPEQEEPDTTAEIQWLDIEPGTKRAVRIPLAEMGQVAAAMEDCITNLIEHWGIDRASQDTVDKPPTMTNVGDIANRVMRDYPSKALRKGRGAEIMLRLVVEADGTASQCVRTDITDAEYFDQTLCDLVMKRGEFEPARDSKGKPLRYYLIQKIRYEIL